MTVYLFAMFKYKMAILNYSVNLIVELSPKTPGCHGEKGIIWFRSGREVIYKPVGR